MILSLNKRNTNFVINCLHDFFQESKTVLEVPEVKVTCMCEFNIFILKRKSLYDIMKNESKKKCNLI